MRSNQHRYPNGILGTAAPLSHVEETRAYFLRLGLSDDEIRKAMTKACFAALRDKEAGR